MKNLEKNCLQQFVDCQLSKRQMHCLKGGDGDGCDGDGNADDGVIVDLISI